MLIRHLLTAALLITGAAAVPATAAADPNPVQTLISNGILYVGSSDADDLLLFAPGNGNTVRLNIGGDSTWEYSFDGTTFTTIDVSAEGGDDRVLMSTVQKNTEIRGGDGDDYVSGGRGIDHIDGGEGNDELWAYGPGTDTLIGGPGFGWDHLGFAPWDGSSVVAEGGDGTDTLFVQGGPAADTISTLPADTAGSVKVRYGSTTIAGTATGIQAVLVHGGPSADQLSVGSGFAAPGIQTYLYGEQGDDVLTGGDGVERFDGGPGSDSMSGGAGRDLFSVFDADQKLDGGDGDDSFYVDYTAQTTAVANAQMTVPVDGGPGDDEYVMTGSPVADSVFVTAQAAGVAVFGYEPQHTRHAVTGVESARLSPGAGDDRVLTNPSVTQPMTLLGGDGADDLHGGAAADKLSGQAGADELYGGGGADVFSNSTIDANGKDEVFGNAGADVLETYGTNDADKFTVYTPNVGPEVLTRSGVQQVAFQQVEKLRLQLGGGDDRVSTSVDLDDVPSVPLEVYGDEGNDELYGGRAGDLLDGGDGDDTLNGLEGSDQLRGGPGADVISWNPYYGSDSIDGGEGDDWLSAMFTTVDNPVTLNRARDQKLQLREGTYQTSAIFTGIETAALQLGDGNDTFTAGDGLKSAVEIRVNGGPGRDTLTGGDGDDLIAGGPGLDQLDGRDGADTYQCGGPGDWFVEGPGDIVSTDCR